MVAEQNNSTNFILQMFTLDLSTISDNLLILSSKSSISFWRFSLSFWALSTWTWSMFVFSACLRISVSTFSLSVSACKTCRWNHRIKAKIPSQSFGVSERGRRTKIGKESEWGRNVRENTSNIQRLGHTVLAFSKVGWKLRKVPKQDLTWGQLICQIARIKIFDKYLKIIL